MSSLKKRILFIAACIVLPGGFIIAACYGADKLLRRYGRATA